ncbi:cysteine-rich receptor-like protein kinase 3 [Rhodamnia argentea]|uniref:Cysteine-rich receptor-like protein kinase 3 n=1 Tax=Rhodamnia argentea TaxID=178133 RepID=A0A8B8MSX1_9MYRT|nr:cysteine-rich receptor-like protein kinase 3 [Rhodamnia argentea]
MLSLPSPASLLFVISSAFFFATLSLSDPRANLAALICTNSTTPLPDRRAFVANFVAAMDAVTPQINAQRFASAVGGGTSGNNTVYAFAECMKDLDQMDCNLCVARAKTQILRCFPFQMGIRGGRLFYDGCYLRYDDYNFFNESLSPQDSTVCDNEDFGGNETMFRNDVVELGRNLSLQAPSNGGFSVGSVIRGNASVYGLAQCWEFVNGSECQSCLNDTAARIGSCPPKEEGRGLNAGCYFMYSTKKFFYNNTEPFGRNEGQQRLIILAAVSSTLALLLIVALAAFLVRMKLVRKTREKRQLGLLVDVVNKSKLNFSYELLEKATGYFHQSSKLGQGGSGSVYKGILPDGKPVAIKRLVFNTRQWVEHFFNEVNLISDIDHKNLVKLFGCSITGPESLLVYEYIPNLSLHDHLFVKKNVPPLNWETRCKIILGTAEGLAYLHEESTLRIIHRDIKLTNVLLDEDFTAKIADFGLARLFPEDATHISTAVAGTLGYMAPEYVVRGKLTEKADVYSYGVLMMEVLSGKKNFTFSRSSFSMLQMVWNLYESGRLCEAIDPILEGQFQEEEASRLLQIGLLCVQASAELRPSMSVVVKMLNKSFEIPTPTQPPFLISSRSTECSRHVFSGPYSSPQKSDTQSTGNATMTESWFEPR